MKTRLAVLAAILFGTVSVALADDQFDVTIYRPAIPDNAHGAYAQTPHAPQWQGGGAVRSFTAEEKLMFERAQGPVD